MKTIKIDNVRFFIDETDSEEYKGYSFMNFVYLEVPQSYLDPDCLAELILHEVEHTKQYQAMSLFKYIKTRHNTKIRVKEEMLAYITSVRDYYIYSVDTEILINTISLELNLIIKKPELKTPQEAYVDSDHLISSIGRVCKSVDFKLLILAEDITELVTYLRSYKLKPKKLTSIIDSFLVRARTIKC